MRIRLGHFTPILGSVAAAVAIAAAPIASAAPSASPATPENACAGSGAGTVCQPHGNVQVYVAPAQVDYFTYRGGAT